MEREVLISSLRYPVTEHMGAVQSCICISQGRSRLDIRNHFFPKRVVKHWHRLPREVVNAPSLSVFKRHLDNALNNALKLLVSPELVRQLDWMITVGPFQLRYSVLPCSVDGRLQNDSSLNLDCILGMPLAQWVDLKKSQR